MKSYVFTVPDTASDQAVFALYASLRNRADGCNCTISGDMLEQLRVQEPELYVESEREFEEK